MLNYALPNHRNVTVFSEIFPHWTSNDADLATLTPALRKAEVEYLRECQVGNFAYSTTVSNPAGITKKGMAYLYGTHFRDGAGSDFYDEVIEDLNGDWKTCCYCGLRPGDTADHYKEKSQFPLLAVFPGNLVPACSSCNRDLGAVTEKFHGYFDSLQGVQWLSAKVDWKQGANPPGLKFKVIAGFSANAGLVHRVETTFKKARLSKVWASMMSSMIARAHRHFEETADVAERHAYVEDLRAAHIQQPNGPYQVAIDAMQSSRWIRELPTRAWD